MDYKKLLRTVSTSLRRRHQKHGWWNN